MPDLEVIDAHAHIFQSADVGIRYQEAIGHKDPERNATVEEMLGFMKQLGIRHTVMLLNTPTTQMYERRLPDLPVIRKERDVAIKELREQMVGMVIRYNEWGVEEAKKHPQFLPFVGIDPNLMSREALVNELEDKRKKRAKGVKIVPNTLRLYLNNPRLWPMYEFCNRTGLPLLTQSGGNFGGSNDGWDAWGRPIYLKPALEDFKDLKVITAHFGRGYPDDIVELARKFPGFYTDLSSQVGQWDEPSQWTVKDGVEWIRKAGADKVIYGTNYPGSDPVKYLSKFKSLPLTSTEMEKIASGNLKGILGTK